MRPLECLTFLDMQLGKQCANEQLGSKAQWGHDPAGVSGGDGPLPCALRLALSQACCYDTPKDQDGYDWFSACLLCPITRCCILRETLKR